MPGDHQHTAAMGKPSSFSLKSLLHRTSAMGCNNLLPRATVWLIASLHPGCFQGLSNSDLPFFFFLIKKSVAKMFFAKVSHSLQKGCQQKPLIQAKESAESYVIALISWHERQDTLCKPLCTEYTTECGQVLSFLIQG